MLVFPCTRHLNQLIKQPFGKLRRVWPNLMTKDEWCKEQECGALPSVAWQWRQYAKKGEVGIRFIDLHWRTRVRCAPDTIWDEIKMFPRSLHEQNLKISIPSYTGPSSVIQFRTSKMTMFRLTHTHNKYYLCSRHWTRLFFHKKCSFHASLLL